MTRTSKYLNQDTIAALHSFQIEKIDREITDYLVVLRQEKGLIK